MDLSDLEGYEILLARKLTFIECLANNKYVKIIQSSINSNF